MGNILADFGALVFGVCGFVLLIAFIIAMIGAIKGNEPLRRTALKVIVVSGIIAMVGFGVCAMNFTLHIE